MTALPQVTAIVINWNGFADTCECLASLLKSDYPDQSILVIDNGSANDEAQQLRQRFGDSIRVLANMENLGFAGGANIGIREALSQGADYVLLLNNDTIVAPDCLSELVKIAVTLPDLAAACPKTYFHDRPQEIYSTGGTVNMWTASARQVGRGQIDRGQFESVEARGYADGVCMLIPKPALERVGLFDEDYFTYWEETDWCTRAGQQGLRSYYVPSSKIWHKAQRSQAPGSDFHYIYRRNALLFVRKRGTRLQLVSALLTHILVVGPLYFLRHPTRISRALAELRALFWHVRNQTQGGPLL